MAFLKTLLVGALASGLLSACGAAQTSPPRLLIPFASGANQVVFQAESGNAPLTVMLDTAVDPSGLDSTTANVLGVQSGQEQAAEGFGSGTSTYRPATLRELKIQGRSFGQVEVAVMDLSAFGSKMGFRLDAILGYSFLKGHAVLIDYTADRLTIFSSRGVEPPGCRQRYQFPLRFLSDEDKIILVPGLRIGGHEVLARLDTGSARGLLIDADSPGASAIRVLLPRGRKDTAMGFRGSATVERGLLAAPATLGPFELKSADTTVTSGRDSQAPVNIGNAFLRALGVQLLVDMPGGRVGLYGSCTRSER